MSSELGACIIHCHNVSVLIVVQVCKYHKVVTVCLVQTHIHFVQTLQMFLGINLHTFRGFLPKEIFVEVIKAPHVVRR